MEPDFWLIEPDRLQMEPDPLQTEPDTFTNGPGSLTIGARVPFEQITCKRNRIPYKRVRNPVAK